MRKINIQKDVDSRKRISDNHIPQREVKQPIVEPVNIETHAQSESIQEPETDQVITQLEVPKKGGRKAKGDL